jgi:hypothetical protein
MFTGDRYVADLHARTRKAISSNNVAAWRRNVAQRRCLRIGVFDHDL